MVDQVNHVLYLCVMEKTVAIGEAKTNLSRIISQVEEGEEVVVRRGPRKVARIVPYSEPASTPLFGLMRGQIRIREDFDEPIPGFEPYT